MNNPNPATIFASEDLFSNEEYEKNLNDPALYARNKFRKSVEFQKIREEFNKKYIFLNWDNEGALPVKTETLKAAEKLVEALDWEHQMPSIFPDVDGTVAFSWVKNGKILNLTINEKEEIAFNYISAETESYGVTKLIKSKISDELSETISRFNG